MAKLRESNSESESKQPSRAATKARNAAAHQAQQEYLSRHINSNGPQDKPKVDPLDFTSLPLKALNEYNKRYNMGMPECASINANILKSSIGKKTISYKRSRRHGEISKIEMANHTKKHFMNMPCKENEIVTNFLYKVKNEDKDFKLTFK